MGNNHAFFIKQPNMPRSRYIMLQYAGADNPDCFVLHVCVHSCWYCKPEHVFVKADWGRRMTRPRSFPLGVKIKCIPVCSLNTFQTDRKRGRSCDEQQHPAWAVFNLSRSYGGEDYNLTTARKTQTETIHADIICNHSPLSGKKRGSLCSKRPYKWGFSASTNTEKGAFSTTILWNWM